MKKAGAIFLSIVVAVALLAGCHNDNESRSMETQAPPQPATVTVTRQDQALALKKVEVLRMTDAQKGWAFTGDAVIFTTDGGQIWRDVSPRSATFSLKKVDGQLISLKAAFLDDQHALVAVPQIGKITVFHTADSGATWQASEIATSEFPDALSHVVSFAHTDNEHAWILTAYDAAMGQELVGIFQTTDGGLSWNTVSETPMEYNGKSDSVPVEGIKQGMYFKDVQNGWLTGETHGNGVWLYSTHDGGKTWTPQNVPIPQGVSADGGAASSRTPVFFTDKEGILPVQYRGDSLVMVFYRTEDGGHTWSPISKLPLDPETMDVVWAFADAEHGFAISGEKLWITTDGGQTWNPSANEEMKFTKARVLNFPDIETGFAISNDSLLKTVDGGKTWSRLIPTIGTSRITSQNTPPQPPHNTPAPDDNFKPNFSQSLKLNNLFGWSYHASKSNSDEVWLTQDGGVSWKDIVPKEIKEEVNSGGREIYAYFKDSQNWWILSCDILHNLVAYRTSDGGERWIKGNTTSITYGDGGLDAQFVDTEHGFVGAMIAGMCTSMEELLVTSDGGMTWLRYPMPVRGKLSMLNDQRGWLSGAWNCVMETEPDSMPFFATADGGKSWNLVNLTLPSDVSDAGPMPVQILDDGLAILPVYDEKQNLTLIYRASQDGKSGTFEGETDGYDPKFTDASHGTIIETREQGKVKVKKATTDGGQTWSIVN